MTEAGVSCQCADDYGGAMKIAGELLVLVGNLEARRLPYVRGQVESETGAKYLDLPESEKEFQINPRTGTSVDPKYKQERRSKTELPIGKMQQASTWEVANPTLKRKAMELAMGFDRLGNEVQHVMISCPEFGKMDMGRWFVEERSIEEGGTGELEEMITLATGSGKAIHVDLINKIREDFSFTESSPAELAKTIAEQIREQRMPTTPESVGRALNAIISMLWYGVGHCEKEQTARKAIMERRKYEE